MHFLAASKLLFCFRIGCFKISRSQGANSVTYSDSICVWQWRKQQDTVINPEHVHQTPASAAAECERLDYGDSTYWMLRYKEKSTEPFLGGTCGTF